jgi:hypothetical protein
VIFASICGTEAMGHLLPWPTQPDPQAFRQLLSGQGTSTANDLPPTDTGMGRLDSLTRLISNDIWFDIEGWESPMPTNSRRRFLYAAGGAALALTGGGTVFAVTRTPSRALRPWRDTELPVADPRLDAFRYAILAPNPHNRQPWQIELVGSDAAVIRCALDRRLPETDPFDRQITIGFGCFLELARIAATSRGLRMDVTAFPEGAPEAPERLDRRPIAKVSFARASALAIDPHFNSIVSRRSAKVPFDLSRPISAETLDTLRRGSVDASADPALVAKLRGLTWDAWMIEARTARTFKESVDLMRIGKAEIEANPDGIALGGALIEALALTGQISRVSLADPSSSAFKAGIDKYRPILATAMGYAWVVTAGNSRRDQLEAGRRYVRMNLASNAAGLSVHPVSQALQEFPEMRELFNAARSQLGVANGSTLQMLARLGYANAQPPAPRWPLDSKVLKS